MFNKKLKKEIDELRSQLEVSATTAGIYKTRLNKTVTDRNKLKIKFTELAAKYAELEEKYNNLVKEKEK